MRCKRNRKISGETWRNKVVQFMMVVANEYLVFIVEYFQREYAPCTDLFSANFDEKFRQISTGLYRVTSTVSLNKLNSLIKKLFF